MTSFGSLRHTRDGPEVSDKEIQDEGEDRDGDEEECAERQGRKGVVVERFWLLGSGFWVLASVEKLSHGCKI